MNRWSLAVAVAMGCFLWALSASSQQPVEPDPDFSAESASSAAADIADAVDRRAGEVAAGLADVRDAGDETVEWRVDQAPTGDEEVVQEVPRRPEAHRHRLTMMLTGNVDGQFARVDCRNQDHAQKLYWARQAAYFHALHRFSDDADLVAPLALNIGNSIFPGVLGRYLLTGHPAGPQRLAQILDDVPAAVHGLGSREFSVPRPALIDVLEQIGDRNIAVQAANLECQPFGGAEAICDAAATSDSYRVVERDGLRIAVATVLAEGLFDWLAEHQREGLRILDPAAVLDGLIDEMRDDADLVIVQYQVPRNMAAPLAYDLGKDVEGIDLIVASHLIEDHTAGAEFDPERPTDGGRMEIIEAPSTGTPIVSANSSTHSAINVELDVVGREDDGPTWELRRVIPRRVLLDEMPYHEEAKQRLESTIDELCAHWGQPIGDKAQIDGEFQLADLRRFVLNIMRFSTDSEVALSNRGAFRDDEQFPLTDHLTKADIYAALPYENELVVADIKGSVLAGLADELNQDVVGAGIEVVDGSVKINSRNPDPDRHYRVSLNDYLADGGDDVLSPDELANRRGYHPGWSPEPPTIDDIIIHTVAEGEHLRRGPEREVIAADDNFPDLHRKFLWNFLGSLNASYNQVAIQNPVVDGEPAYDQGQLTAQSTDQLNLEGRLAANADSRNHGWANELTAQYAAARVSDDEERFEETKDRVRLRSRYRYKRLRADLEGRWFVPDPVVEGQAESEFRSPDTREWHRLDLRAIVAASFQLFDPLDVRLGANVRRDVNEPEGRATTGLNASYTLSRISPLRLLDRPIRVESEVEYFFNDIGNQNIHETRSSNRIYFAVFEQFFFTTTFNAFLYRDDVVGELGTNTELTIGINYDWETSRQKF